MMRNKQGKLCLMMVLVGLVTTSAMPVIADSISIEPIGTMYYLFEPIIARVTLHLDEPILRDANPSPIEATRWQRRLKRRLTAVLRDGNDVCDGVVGGVGFDIEQREASEAHATVMIFLGDEIPGEKESSFRFWATPGKFTLVVLDDENGLESNPIMITLRPPNLDTLEASRLFSSGALGTLLVVFGTEHGDTAVAAFRKLAQHYSQTVYGQYARIALAIRCGPRYGFARNGAVGCEDVDPEKLAVELKASSQSFVPDHPLRTRAILELSYLQPRYDSGDPEETLSALLSETSGGELRREASRRLEDLRRSRAGKTSEGERK